MSATEIAVANDPGLAAAPAPRALIDYDFPSVLSAPPKQRLVLWLMAAIVATVALALGVARVDIIIRANGKLITGNSQIVVQPLETSIVRAVDVKPGEKVKKGAILAILDPTFTRADENELAAKLGHLQATSARLEAEIADRPYDPADPTPDQSIQRRIFRQRQAEYLAKINAWDHKVDQVRADLAAHKIEAAGLAEQIKLVGQQKQMFETLVAKSLASRLKLLDASQRLVEAQSRLDTNLGEQKKLGEQISETMAERQAFTEEWQRKLSEELAQSHADRDAAAAQLSKAKLRRELSVLRAPADATVLEIADRPAGSVVRGAETLIRLVPAGTPQIAEVEIDTRDVARLHVGNRVTLKLEALPWQQFGLAHGVLRSLSADVLSDDNPRETAAEMNAPGLRSEAHQSPIHYRARVEVTKTEFRNLPAGFMLRPGMRLVADIKVGRRSVLDYILNPITRVLDESVREP
jgi:membrane fusion protein, hemolysin D